MWLISTIEMQIGQSRMNVVVAWSRSCWLHLGKSVCLRHRNIAQFDCHNVIITHTWRILANEAGPLWFGYQWPCAGHMTRCFVFAQLIMSDTWVSYNGFLRLRAWYSVSCRCRRIYWVSAWPRCALFYRKWFPNTLWNTNVHSFFSLIVSAIIGRTWDIATLKYLPPRFPDRKPLSLVAPFLVLKVIVECIRSCQISLYDWLKSRRESLAKLVGYPSVELWFLVILICWIREQVRPGVIYLGGLNLYPVPIAGLPVVGFILSAW